MTYNEAEVFVNEKASLVGSEFFIPKIDAYGKIFCLLISPKHQVTDVLQCWLINDRNNKTALVLLGLIDSDMEVYVIGHDGKLMYPLSYEDYLRHKG